MHIVARLAAPAKNTVLDAWLAVSSVVYKQGNLYLPQAPRYVLHNTHRVIQGGWRGSAAAVLLCPSLVILVPRLMQMDPAAADN